MPKVKLSERLSLRHSQAGVLNIVLQYIVTLQLIIEIISFLKTIFSIYFYFKIYIPSRYKKDTDGGVPFHSSMKLSLKIKAKCNI